MLLILVIGVTSCNDEQEEILLQEVAALKYAAVYDSVITLPGILYEDYECTSNNLYLLAGKTYVKKGATLTIEAGTRIEGMHNSNPVNASALIISRGAKIIAEGTEEYPIVFTAHINFNNPTIESGDWGGLIILGKAPNSRSNREVCEGIYPPCEPRDVDYRFGGNDPNDNSGILKYVRVEYAGVSIAEDNELNSFTFCSVGAGTTIERCQAYYGADDGFEFFGGTVNAKYLVSLAAQDDAFDFDCGYQGNLQFLIALLDPCAPYSKDANGVECDHEEFNDKAKPKTRPVISNLTIVGIPNGESSQYNPAFTFKNMVCYGTRFGKNTRFVLRNSIVYGYKTAMCIDDKCGDISGTVTNDVTKTNDITHSVLAHNVIGKIDYGSWYNSGWSPGTSNNLTDINNMGIKNPFEISTYFNSHPRLGQALIACKQPALGTNFTNLDSFFSPTAYKGALTSNNYWLAEKWLKTEFPNTSVY